MTQVIRVAICITLEISARPNARIRVWTKPLTFSANLGCFQFGPKLFWELHGVNHRRSYSNQLNCPIWYKKANINTVLSLLINLNYRLYNEAIEIHSKCT